MIDDKLTHIQRLELITRMIGQAKENTAKTGSFYFLIWGSAVIIANFGQYILAEFTAFEMPFLVWGISIPAAIISIWYGNKKRHISKMSTHFDHVIIQVWICVGVAIAACIYYSMWGGSNTIALILLVTGMGTYLTGRIIKFVPLVFGGVTLWVFSAITFHTPIEYQFLLGGIAYSLGYMIPGIMLRKREKANV